MLITEDTWPTSDMPCHLFVRVSQDPGSVTQLQYFDGTEAEWWKFSLFLCYLRGGVWQIIPKSFFFFGEFISFFLLSWILAWLLNNSMKNMPGQIDQPIQAVRNFHLRVGLGMRLIWLSHDSTRMSIHHKQLSRDPEIFWPSRDRTGISIHPIPPPCQSILGSKYPGIYWLS